MDGSRQRVPSRYNGSGTVWSDSNPEKTTLYFYFQESSILLITESSTVPTESPVVKPETSQVEEPVIPTTSNGSDSSICRICQLGFEESGKRKLYIHA